MNYFNNMRLTSKIYFLVIILLTGLILSALFSYLAVLRFKEASDIGTKVLHGREFQSQVTNPAFGLWGPIRLAYFIQQASTPAEAQEHNATFQQFKQKYKEAQEWARNTLPDTEHKRLVLGPFDTVVQSFFSMWDSQYWPAVQAGNKEETLHLIKGPMMNLFRESEAVNKQIVDSADKVQRERLAERDKDFESAEDASRFSFWLSFLAVLLGLFVSIWVAKSIYASLKQIVSGISQVSSEISNQIDTQGSSVAQLSTSVHETTTSMDELNASFQHTEALAAESSGRAKNALKHSDEGNALTTEMLEGLTLHKDKVSAIVEQIARLSEITHQIHNVAAATSNLTNQTNILALNAAVQSAHVKQQTEGFSVIASEIRKLADESKKFLSHIDVLAENIKHATDGTMTLAEDGQKTLQECIKLAQSVSKSFGSIMTINNGSFEGAEQVVLNVKEQVHAVHQVLGAMEIVNNVSQETLAGMNQVRKELEKLNSFSETLKAIV